MRQVIHAVSRVLGLLAAILLFAMVLLITVDVVLREATGRAIPGVVDYSEILMIGLVFAGLAYAQSSSSHINVVIISSRLPRRLASVLFAVAMVVVCLFAGWFLVEATDKAIEATITGEVRWGITAVPIWPARILLAVGVFVFLLELVITTVDAIKASVTGVRMTAIHGKDVSADKI